MDLQGCQQNSTIANPNLVFLFLLSLCVWWLIVFVCFFFAGVLIFFSCQGEVNRIPTQ